MVSTWYADEILLMEILGKELNKKLLHKVLMESQSKAWNISSQETNCKTKWQSKEKSTRYELCIGDIKIKQVP